MSMPNSFFVSTDGHWFEPTWHTRGPWDANACHAGPPTGLLARALEHAVADKRLARLSVDFLRPIPFSGFSIDTQVVRAGRTLTTTRARIIDKSDREYACATGLHLAEQPLEHYASAHSEPFEFELATPGDFPLRKAAHNLDSFKRSVEIRYPPGQDGAPGPTTLWMRTVALLPDEEPSAFQRICPLADCGNAFSRNAEPTEVSFLNADLTISLHRDPVGEWFGSQSVGFWHANGHGVADALLFDRQGAVGRALQTLVLRAAKHDEN